jgi:hypothetical protein
MAKDLKESGSAGSTGRMEKMVSKAAVTGAIPKSGTIHADKVDQSITDHENLRRDMKSVFGKKYDGGKRMSTQEAVDKNAYNSDASPDASYRYTKEKAKETMKPVSTKKKKKRK